MFACVHSCLCVFSLQVRSCLPSRCCAERGQTCLTATCAVCFGWTSRQPSSRSSQPSSWWAGSWVFSGAWTWSSWQVGVTLPYAFPRDWGNFRKSMWIRFIIVYQRSLRDIFKEPITRQVRKGPERSYGDPAHELNTHVLNTEFQLMSAGMRYKVPRCRRNRYEHSMN